MKSNNNITPGLMDGILIAASGSDEKHRHLDNSKVMQKAQKADSLLASEIRSATEKCESVEDLIFLERSLQNIDMQKSRSMDDKTSIISAQNGYAALSDMVEMAHENPEAYITSNRSALRGKEKGAGAENLDRTKPVPIASVLTLSHVNGNVTRMRNRASFSPEGERDYWEARIELGRKTSEMFTALHKTVAQNQVEKEKKNQELETPKKNKDKEQGENSSEIDARSIEAETQRIHRENKAIEESIAKYDSSLSIYMTSQKTKMEKMESQINNSISDKEAALTKHESKKPGLLKGKQAKEAWQAEKSKLKKDISKLHNEKKKILAAKSEKAVIESFRSENPELATAYDVAAQEKRLREVNEKERKKQEQEKTKEIDKALEKTLNIFR